MALAERVEQGALQIGGRVEALEAPPLLDLNYTHMVAVPRVTLMREEAEEVRVLRVLQQLVEGQGLYLVLLGQVVLRVLTALRVQTAGHLHMAAQVVVEQTVVAHHPILVVAPSLVGQAQEAVGV